jgi:LPS export ABC transporter protein LptC
MKRSESARYARWSAAVAVALAVLTIGVYVRHRWAAYRETKSAPPSAAPGVDEQLHGLTFSKMEGPHKIFTVDATRSTDFKDQDARLLEDVKITIFGKTAERHDLIHTQSCRYGKSNGSIVCSGEVQMDLESAADAERSAKNPETGPPQVLHVETRGVTFDRGSGLAKTDQPVTFAFPRGTGRGVGIEYNSDQGSVRLLKDVQFTLKPPEAAGSSKKTLVSPGDVYVSGASLDFDRDVREMRLYGPAEAHTETVRLTSNKMIVDLDNAFRAQLFHAEKNGNGARPHLEMHTPTGASVLDSDSIDARLVPEGWVTSVDARGEVRGNREDLIEREEFASQEAHLDLWPRVTQPKELHLKGRALIKTQARASTESRTLESEALRVAFTGSGSAGQRNAPQLAETLAPGILEWTDASSAGVGASRTKLRADKLQMEFGREGKARQLVANGNLQTERAFPGKASQTATANSGVAQLLPSGGWSQMDLQGDVRLQEADRNARADHAVFRRLEQTALLTGQAVVRDTSTETHAPRITFMQSTGDIRAEGGVRSTDFAPRGSTVQLAPVPANITSDAMQANSKTGRALYNGHARLWQGDAVLEADAIELLKATRVMNANGNVRGVFPQTTAQNPGQALVVKASTKKANLWHVRSGTLSYYDTENRAHLERDVVAQSADQVMRAPVVELYFTHNASLAQNSGTGPNGSGSAANGAAGGQQISRAVGAGGVIVEQSARKATAERGDYTASDGKFVMTGGNPTLYDGTEGTTTGRQLTFFLADDTIIVDSGNGSRTLTKHRVEK